MAKKKITLSAIAQILSVAEVVVENESVVLTEEQASAIEKSINDSNEVITSLSETVAALEKKLAAIETNVSKSGLLPLVDFEGKSLRFKVGKFTVKINGEVKIFTAEEASKNNDVIKHLLAIKSSAVEEIA